MLFRSADVYAYDVYFSAAMLGDAQGLEIVDEGAGQCEDTWTHTGGMVRDARAATVAQGGSAEEQTLTLAASMAVATGGEYFKLVLNRDQRVTASDGACFDWGVDADELRAALAVFANSTFAGANQSTAFEVTRSGLGAQSLDSFGYTYAVRFVGDDVTGDMPALHVVTDRDLTASLYHNKDNASHTAVGQDDATFVGAYTENFDTVYTVSIVSADKLRTVNTNSSKHPLYAEQDFNSERKGNDTFVVWVVEANKGIQRARLGPFNCSDVPIELANGVSVKFGKSEGHTVGDTWTLPVVRCGDSFPGYASAAVATVAEGTRDVKQVTLDAGLKGEASRYANTWMLLPPTLTVHGADVEVQSITIRDTEDAYWNRPGPAGAGGPHYRIGFNGNDTKCLSWDAPDWVVEETIDSLWECAKHDKGDCVTVTRRQDATHAPNGFIYNVYFDGAQFANVNVPELQVNFNRSNNCSGFERSEEHTSELQSP